MILIRKLEVDVCGGCLIDVSLVVVGVSDGLLGLLASANINGGCVCTFFNVVVQGLQLIVQILRLSNLCFE